MSTLYLPILLCGMGPYTEGNCIKLERVQRTFLRFIESSLNIPHPLHDYTVAKRLRLDFLAKCRYVLSTQFLNNLLSGKIYSPTLLSLINFKVPPFNTPFTKFPSALSLQHTLSKGRIYKTIGK